MELVQHSPGSAKRLGRVVLFSGLIAMTLAILPVPANAQSSPRNELNRVRLQIQRELRARPEMLQAKNDWIELRRDYQLLRRAVVGSLNRDSDYLSVRAQMWRIEDELAELSDYYRNGIAPADQVFALASRILELRLELTRMESDAVARHSEAMAAREAYVQAGRRLLELNRGIRDLVRSDPRFQDALARLQSGGRGGLVGGAGGTGGRPGARRP